ncbi:MAG: hypothetical protein Q7R81_03370 [Candidatus Peregrinibacteria bacterium]|nr:hypothetical protein [Candidatus Peregrinibacteria bacterium]
MNILTILLGVLPATLIGWLLVRVVEGRTPVLLQIERIALGFVLGLTLTMFTAFVLNITGLIAFAAVGFAIADAVLLIPLIAILAWRRQPSLFRSAVPPPSPPLPPWVKGLAVILGIWIVAKIAAGAFILLATPAYFDDVYNNWNMRGKLFFETEALTLEIPAGNEGESAGGVSSYPPTVPMVKAMLSTIPGEWREGVVSGVHILWYIAILVLLYGSLRRRSNTAVALLGTYIFASLPLPLVHGSTAYADIFLAAHLLPAVAFLFHALSSDSVEECLTHMRLSALCTALLVFTKNEALVLHLPPLLLLVLISILWLRKQNALTGKQALTALAWYVVSIAMIAIPWIAFKFAHGLPFGNAKSISGLSIAWQEGVAYAIWINTFFEGNWNLLPPLLILLLIALRKEAFRTPLVILSAFFLIVYLGQMPLYFFTGISTEALKQTGYARGLVQLMPIAVLLTTLLLHEKAGKWTVSSG